MIRSAALALLLLLIATPLARADSTPVYPTPAPGLLERIRDQHHRGDWLRVTADGSRLELRARGIDERGLNGLTPRRGGVPPDDPLPWSAISRIDKVQTHVLRGRITGFVVGGLAGMAAGALATQGNGKAGTITGWLAGSAAGVWAGGTLGASNPRERLLYVAPSSESSPPVATIEPAPDSAMASRPESTASTSAIAEPSPDAAAVPATPASPPSAAILRATRRLDEGALLRVSGDFGNFQGYASTIGPEGLGGLRPDLRVSSSIPGGPVTWNRIYSIERRGSSAARGAATGAMSIGATVGLFSFMLVEALGDGSVSGGEAFLEGAAAGGALGAAIGGLIGAAVPRWHRVYER